MSDEKTQDIHDDSQILQTIDNDGNNINGKKRQRRVRKASSVVTSSNTNNNKEVNDNEIEEENNISDEEIKSRRSSHQSRGDEGMEPRSLSRASTRRIRTPIPNDDLVLDEQDDRYTMVTSIVDQPEVSQSTHDALVYVQQSDRFRSWSRDQANEYLTRAQQSNANIESSDVWQPPIMGTMDIALHVQSAFFSLGLILTGLVAGFSIADTMFAFVFVDIGNEDIRQNRQNSILIYYAPNSLYLRCAEYAAITISAVMILDRVDMQQDAARAFKRALTVQNGGIGIGLCLVALAASLFALPIEHKLSLYFDAPSSKQLESSDEPPTVADLVKWRASLFTRMICMLLTWLVVALRPNTHLLLKHMHRAVTSFEEEFIKNKPKADELI